MQNQVWRRPSVTHTIATLDWLGGICTISLSSPSGDEKHVEWCQRAASYALWDSPLHQRVLSLDLNLQVGCALLTLSEAGLAHLHHHIVLNLNLDLLYGPPPPDHTLILLKPLL